MFFGTKLNNTVSFGLKLGTKARDSSSWRNSQLRVVAEKVVGIDLETRNSAVAAMEGGKPTFVTNVEGQRTTPSVVSYTKTGDRLVGLIAKRQAVLNPVNTFFSVKRFIGRMMPEVDEESKQVSYHVARDENGNVKLDCPAIGKQFAAEETSAQRTATKDAGRIAGLEVLRIINEPTASSLPMVLRRKAMKSFWFLTLEVVLLMFQCFNEFFWLLPQF